MNKKFYVVTLAIVFTFNLALAARAQSALDGFDPNADWFVRVVTAQPDGKSIIGGEFTVVKGISRNRIARLNPDGTLDALFDPDANGAVLSIALQPDGKILVGGDFTSIGGQARNRIARLDPITGLADSFNPNANAIVSVITVQADGKILLGGDFTTLSPNGGAAVTRNRIARLETTGAADAFNPNADGFGFPGPNVYAITIQPDGKILVGGSFSTIGGQSRKRIARLDPVTAQADSFDPNVVDNFSSVQEIIVQPDGKILVGGGFSNIGGQSRSCVARLDPVTGAADSWNPSADNTVYAMALQSDGKVLIGGDFGSVGGMTTFMARLHPVTGAPEATFNTVFNERVVAIALQPDGKIVAGGFFITVGGQTRNRIARLETNGGLDRTLPGLYDVVFATAAHPDGKILIGDTVHTTAVQPDGKILIGGRFTSVRGVTRRYIARLNADGTLDMAFDPNSNDEVFSIAVQTDGKVLAGGQFTTIGGQTRNCIARLDATTGAADSFNPDASDRVFSIALQPNGKILLGGNFTTIGGQTRNHIARFDPTSGAVDSFDPNANSFVGAIAVQADGKILVGGSFTNIGGQNRSVMARLDGASGDADAFNPNPDSSVTSITVQPDGKILAGGFFLSIGGQARNRIARLDAATGLADSFNPDASDGIYTIGVQADGRVFAGGNFTSIGGQARNRIARLDGTTGAADGFNPDADGRVNAIAVQADGKLLAGGNFVNIGGQGNNHFARLSNGIAALQNLAATQTTVTWTRGGSSPQLTRVTFESSTDNVNYTPLGNGIATGSNWTLTGLSLPTGQNIYIRARGYYRNGYFNSSESSTESVRNAYLAPQYTISGTVTYGNAIGNPVPPRFVRNVSMASTVGSPAVGPVITGTPGTYTLTGFGSGGYTIKPTKPGGSNTAITSNDAARVAQGVSSSVPFVSLNQKFASDASGNGTVSSNDAALIARFAAGLTGTANVGQWKFFIANLPGPPTAPLPTPPYNDSRTYASVASNLTGEDYVALLIGEASGNYNPATHPRPAGKVNSGQWTVNSEDGRAAERPITITVEPVVTSANKEIVIPVNVEGVTGREIISYEFDLRYDPSVMEPLKNPVDVAGTVSRGLMVVTNPYEPGLLRVVVYGSMPIDGDGVLLNLRFTAVGAEDSVSPLTFERIMFNDGEPRVNVADGRVKLVP